MKTLNVIGAGRVGRTLASLWEEKHTFVIQDVLDGTEAGARSAVAFIGDGRPVSGIDMLRHADVWMITTPDRQIAGTAERLADAGLLGPADIVFHCSGSLSSADLSAAAATGALTASVHPLKTFAEPRDAVRTFSGTYCAAEGAEGALLVLQPAFERVGGKVSLIDAQAKVIYHAASVIVCNYLTSLMETGLRCYEQSGIDRETATAMTEPIVRETLENVMQLGPARALTGPIARGDASVVARHLEALDAWDERVASVYRALGTLAVELARSRGDTDMSALERIAALLSR
jgi:predicted short-subunit dehydrogenase-like oxidoreductase (DUF2520 family)